LRKYLEFLEALVGCAEGKYPVGQPLLRGVTDLAGTLRGHTQALIDCVETPERFRDLSRRCTEAFIKVLQAHYRIIKPYHGGHFIEQFSLWAPDRIVRLQEDASAVYSPNLYRNLIQENDRLIAQAFPLSLIHLHSSSLFLLDSFLEIEEIDVFQINKDAVGMSFAEMLPYLKRVQEDKRCLLIRGILTENDLKLVKENLSPAGLLLQVVADNAAEAGKMRGKFLSQFGAES
jgi:hypothetical protein